VLVLASGDRKVDQSAVARVVEASAVRLAKPSEVLKITGYTVGGVPPLGHPRPIRTVIDPRLFDHAIVYAAAGGPTAIFPIEPARLLDITSAILADVSG
jgi:prolyl-tRNA editing enzyme YbaK/EbsC (Cys-tRNA(Pro) deacylase)